MANSPTMVRSQYHELTTKENAEIFLNLFPKRTLVEGLIAALTANVFSQKSEIDEALKVAKAPVFLYRDSSKTAVMLDYEEIKAMELTKESLLHAAGGVQADIDFESWPESKEKPLPPAISKAIYEVHRIRKSYGFSGDEADAILLLRSVRDHLERAFNVELKSWNAVSVGNSQTSEGQQDARSAKAAF